MRQLFLCHSFAAQVFRQGFIKLQNKNTAADFQDLL